MTESDRFSNQNAGMTVNDSDRMVVGQRQSPLESASGIGEALFLPETKTNFSSRCQLETSIQMAGTTGIEEEMDVDEREVNSVSLRKTDQTHSTFENKTVFENEHLQLCSMKSIRVSATAENVNDQCQNQDPHAALTSSNQVGSTAESITEEGYPSQTIESGHKDVTSEKETILTNEHQQIPTGQCPHRIPVLSTSYDKNRKIQAEKSTQTAVMTDIGNDAVQDSDPAKCSNYARTSGLTHLKTEMWKKLKFSTRVLKGHTGLVCGVDCRNSLLVSTR